MIEFRSFQMFLILMIPFTAVTQHRISITVRVEDEATLPCKDVKDYQDKCLSTSWIFNYLTTGPSVPLFEYGKIHREAAAKSDRLSVTEKCSLVIKKVTVEDVGHYTCRQFISGQTVTDSQIDLTVNKRDNIATPTTTTDPAAAETSLNAGCRIRLMFVLVGVAALSMIVVSVNIWSRTKGSKTPCGKKQNSDEDDDVVMYENAEDVSAPVRFHRSTNQL